jgi:glycosyltransferase involved in cell wall biosynthesis
LDNKPAALFLAPEAPYPIAGGGALRSASLLEYVGRRYATHLIVFREPGAPDPARQIPSDLAEQITVLNLPANGRSLAARTLRNAGRMARGVPPLIDRFSGFGEVVQQAVHGRRYEIGIIEHFWCAPYHTQIARLCDRTVLNLHNIESVLHRRCAEVQGGAVALGHRVFHRAALELERQYLPRFTSVLTTSLDDAALARDIAPKARVSVYPNTVPLVPRPDPGDDLAVVFSGNLEYHPNIDAVRYFRTAIWPALRHRHPNLVWRLVGKNPHGVANFAANDPRIHLIGPVPDAVAELARSRIAVVPLRTGSGTRLKILEAWAAGLPVVSTTIGSEGLPAYHEKNLLLADSPADFAAAITRLLTCPDVAGNLGLAGRLLLEKDFTWEAAWKTLDF